MYSGWMEKMMFEPFNYHVDELLWEPKLNRKKKCIQNTWIQFSNVLGKMIVCEQSNKKYVESEGVHREVYV